MSVPPFDAVVVHCTTYLGHLEAIFAMLPVQSVTIYSKCGVMPQLEVRAATRLRIVNASNVGSCDHTYAAHLASLRSFRDSTLLFIKDTTFAIPIHQASTTYNALQDVLAAAAGPSGFGCGMHISMWRDLAQWHSTKLLGKFKMESYWVNSGRHGPGDKTKRIKSSYANLSMWWVDAKRSADLNLPEVIPVCYGGMFAFRESNARSVRWAALLPSLRNLEVNHFMERTWAGVLSRQVPPALLDRTHHLEKRDVPRGTAFNAYPGALVYYKQDKKTARPAPYTGPLASVVFRFHTFFSPRSPAEPPRAGDGTHAPGRAHSPPQGAGTPAKTSAKAKPRHTRPPLNHQTPSTPRSSNPP